MRELKKLFKRVYSTFFNKYLGYIEESLETTEILYPSLGHKDVMLSSFQGFQMDTDQQNMREIQNTHSEKPIGKIKHFLLI